MTKVKQQNKFRLKRHYINQKVYQGPEAHSRNFSSETISFAAGSVFAQMQAVRFSNNAVMFFF